MIPIGLTFSARCPTLHNLPVSFSTCTSGVEVNLISDDADAPLPVRSRARAKIPGVRATCEACRKLKVKCLPAHDDGPCQKCTKKGERCVRMPRAAYGSRTKRR